MKRRRAALLAAVAVAAGLGLVWLAQSGDGTAPLTAYGSGRFERASGSATSDQLPAAIRLSVPRPGIDDAADVFLTHDLRYRLEDMLLQAGEAGTPAALKQKLAELVPRHFSPRDGARAIALVERYVDYRVGLGEMKAPADLGDPRALRTVLDARQRLRERHFSADEYRVLFAQEEELDRFTLARLEIERNQELTAADKGAALREAEQELSESQRSARTQAVVQMKAAAQTAAFEAAGASENERYEQRRAQYGQAAAARLALLDREERTWQARLDEYAATQARHVPAGDLERARQQLFTPQEQLRLEGALALRAQAAAVQPRQ